MDFRKLSLILLRANWDIAIQHLALWISTQALFIFKVNLFSQSILFQESVPVPGEGEFVDLNTTDCCSPGSWGHPEAGDRDTHHCDTVLARDRRTLVVRRRTTAEMTGSILQDSSWLETIDIVSDLLSEANHPCEHCHHARVLLTSIMTFLCGYFKSWQEINEKSATKWYINWKNLHI